MITIRKIRARWKLDGYKKVSKPAILRAIRRTRNSYGITCQGVPYVSPRVGMRVVCCTHGNGEIIAIGKPLTPAGDPEVTIKTAAGTTIYLHQTTLNGYLPLASTPLN